MNAWQINVLFFTEQNMKTYNNVETNAEVKPGCRLNGIIYFK